MEFIMIDLNEKRTPEELFQVISENHQTSLLMDREIRKLKGLTNKNPKKEVINEDSPAEKLTNSEEKIDIDLKEKVDYYYHLISSIDEADDMEAQIRMNLPSPKTKDYESIVLRLKLELLKKIKDTVEFVKEAKDIFEEEDLEEYKEEIKLYQKKLEILKKTDNNTFIGKDKLNDRIDCLLELGFESNLKKGLDLLNYDLESIKKIKLCIELGINKDKIDSVVLNNLSNISHDDLQEYLYNAVEYNEPVGDDIKTKKEFLNIISAYEEGKRLYNIDGVLISKHKVKRKLRDIDDNEISTKVIYNVITTNTILNDDECQKINSVINSKKIIKK
mgnify:CR=1 FL=1